MLEGKVVKSSLAGKGVGPEEGIVSKEGVLALTKVAAVEGVHRAAAGRGRLAVKGPAGRRGADTAHAGKPVDAADVATRKGALSHAARAGPGEGTAHRAIGIKADRAASGHVAKAHAAEGCCTEALAAGEWAAAKAHAAEGCPTKALTAHEGATTKAHATAAKMATTEAHATAAKMAAAEAHTAAAKMAAAEAHTAAAKSAPAEVPATRGRRVTP